jgi:hypothetical protein
VGWWLVEKFCHWKLLDATYQFAYAIGKMNKQNSLGIYFRRMLKPSVISILKVNITLRSGCAVRPLFLISRGKLLNR